MTEKQVLAPYWEIFESLLLMILHPNMNIHKLEKKCKCISTITL